MSTGGYSSSALLDSHRLYDQYVDVVSAFEWVFTEAHDLKETVRHFERFPTVLGADGNPATPDFSVAFNDGTALVGEIARIALHENSVDSLCEQIVRYDQLVTVPGPDNRPLDASSVDVILFVPLELGTDVVRRVLRERLEESSHPYKPSHPPCIVQYVAQADKYVFQRRPDAGNGELREGSRTNGFGSWLLRGDFKPPASGFAHVKARRPFMNDPVAPLYLASQLWTKVLPVLVGGLPAAGDYQPWIGSTSDIATKLTEMYGPVSKSAVRDALGVLVASRSAEALGSDRWRIAWGSLGSRSGEDVAEVLARRAERPPAKGPIKRLQAWYPDNGLSDPAYASDPEPGRLF